MGVNYNTKIVTNGLTLCVDPGNVKSYPGSGTKLYDVSTTSKPSFTLNGTTTYYPANTSILYDATTGYAQSDTTLSLATTALTVCAWVKVYTHGNWNDFVFNHWVNSGWILFGADTYWAFGIGQGGTQYASAVGHNLSTNWNFLTGVYDGATSKIYANGVDTRDTQGSFSSATLDTGYNIRIGNSSDPGNYEISQVTVYNRALSLGEIQQNFNALRGRFGV